MDKFINKISIVIGILFIINLVIAIFEPNPITIVGAIVFK